MKKWIAISLLALASGYVANSTIRYRPCHVLRTDMSIPNNEFDRHCPRRAD
jgi:hypothetical protein